MTLLANGFSGRSAASCRNQYNLLTNRVSSVLAPSLPLQGPPAPKPKKKRPSGGASQPLIGEASLQPQQYQFAPINEPSNPSAFQTAPFTPGEAPEKSGKKRGRPSKAEHELRIAEAAARGEVYQPTKRKPKTPRPSTEGVEGGDSADTPGSKKKAKKQKYAAESMGPPGEPSAEGLMYQHTASPGDQMQVDTPERQPRSTIPETQTSDFVASESLLAGLKEQAAQSGAPPQSAPSQIETAQSSMTLQQGSIAGERPKDQPTQLHKAGQAISQPPEAKMT